MQQTIQISTSSHNGLYDITRQVEAIVSENGVQTGMVNVYAQGATSAIMILFNLMYPLSALVLDPFFILFIHFFQQLKNERDSFHL